MVPALPVRGGVGPAAGAADYRRGVADDHRRYPGAGAGGAGAGLPDAGRGGPVGAAWSAQVAGRFHRLHPVRGGVFWRDPGGVPAGVAPAGQPGGRDAPHAGAGQAVPGHFAGALSRAGLSGAAQPGDGAGQERNCRAGPGAGKPLGGLYPGHPVGAGIHDPDPHAGVFLSQGPGRAAGVVWQLPPQ